MATIDKRFRILGREDTEALLALRHFLAKELHLYCERVISQKSGGRSGDLGVEEMEYEMYAFGSENSWTEGTVHVYTVLDNTTNGYARHISVLASLPDGSTVREKLLTFLESAQFASNYSSFKDRVFGSHSFRGYLDELPDLAQLQQAFKHVNVDKSQSSAATTAK